MSSPRAEDVTSDAKEEDAAPAQQMANNSDVTGGRHGDAPADDHGKGSSSNTPWCACVAPDVHLTLSNIRFAVAKFKQLFVY